MDEKYPLALPQGTVLAGQYVIEKTLGQGGFGITYRAKDHKTGQPVAVKEFFPDAMATRTQQTTVMPFSGERGESFTYGKTCFLQEAETLAQFIGNEGIVRVHTYFEENGTAYFVMDYVEGTSFEEYIANKGGKISYEDAERILLPVIDALAAVHSKGIVHRDVTPDNIYITNDGSVKLLDFGAARYSLGDKSRSLDVVLKHGFAPKEQYTRRGKQGPFTDVYAVGATFYFAITGKRPPDSIERMDEDDLVPPSSRGVNIPKEKEDAILQALSVQPQDRFQTMVVFKRALMQADARPMPNMQSMPENQPVPNVQPNPNPNMARGMAPGSVPNTGMNGSIPNTGMNPGGMPNPNMGMNPGGMPNPNTGMNPGAVPGMAPGSVPNTGMNGSIPNTGMNPGGMPNPNMGMNPGGMSNPNMGMNQGAAPGAVPAKKKKWILPVGISAAVAVIAIIIIVIVINNSGDSDIKTAGNQTPNPSAPTASTEPYFGQTTEPLELPTENPTEAPSEEPSEEPVVSGGTQEILGNTADNLRNGGQMITDDVAVYYAYPGGGLKCESLDGSSGYFMDESGMVESISQVGDWIYYLSYGMAYQVKKDGSSLQKIPVLDGVSVISNMYVTEDHFFVFKNDADSDFDEKGLRSYSRSTGAFEGGIVCDETDYITFANGMIYYLVGQIEKEVWCVSMDDINATPTLVMDEQMIGNCISLSSDGQFVYGLVDDEEGEQYIIVQYDTLGINGTCYYYLTYDNGWKGNLRDVNVVNQNVYFSLYRGSTDAYTIHRFYAEPGVESFDIDTLYTLEEGEHVRYLSLVGNGFLAINSWGTQEAVILVTLDGSNDPVIITE